jgi:hypothetical protein
MLFPLHRATLPVHAIQGSIPTFSILVSLKNTKLLSIQFFQKNSMPGPDVQQVHAPHHSRMRLLICFQKIESTNN